MSAKFGWLNNDDWKKALDIADWKIADNVWVERPHQGNIVRGGSYSDLLELSEYADVYVEQFSNQEELDEIVNRLELNSNILKDKHSGFLYARGEEDFRFSKNKEDIESYVKDCLSDGRGVEFFTKNKAIEALKNHSSEALAVWLLK